LDLIAKVIKHGKFTNLGTIKDAAIEFTNYMPSSDLFLVTNINFHFFMSGLVEAGRVEVLTLLPNTFGTWKEIIIEGSYLVRVIACLWTIYLIYLKIKFRKVIGDY
jgi:hypothetical protein